MSEDQRKKLTDEYDLEDMDGVGPVSAKKMNEKGITNLYDIVIQTPKELQELLEWDYDKCVKLVEDARKILEETGWARKSMYTAKELLIERSNLEFLTTGSKALDGLLGGKGIEVGATTEVYGIFGCLTEDTRMISGDGSITSLDKIVKTHLAIDEKVLVSRSSSCIATTFFKYEKASIIEIITESGKSIKGSPNYTLLMKNDTWYRLDEIKIGDSIQTVMKIPDRIKEYVKTNFVIKSYKNNHKYKGKIPKIMDEDLASICGFIIGDGYIRSRGYSVGFCIPESKLELEKPLISMMKNTFGLPVKKYTQKIKSSSIHGRIVNRTEIIYNYEINSKGVVELLSFLKEKRVPDMIFRSNNKIVSKFLRWLYSTDGTVTDGDRNQSRMIGLTAKNIELLRDVQILLLRFGIHSRIYKQTSVHALIINRGNDILMFEKEIGFEASKRNKKLISLANKIKIRTRTIGSKNQSSGFEKIRKIIHHEEKQTVCDIEVLKTRRFIANGMAGQSSFIRLKNIQKVEIGKLNSAFILWNLEQKPTFPRLMANFACT